MKNNIDYLSLIDEAMYGVIKKILTIVEKEGLRGDSCLFISFSTIDAGVILSESLKQRYPQEMSIILQHQFTNLKVFEDHFSVTLSFDGVPTDIKIPLESIKYFSDPSVNFALSFQTNVKNTTQPDIQNDKAGKIININDFKRNAKKK